MEDMRPALKPFLKHKESQELFDQLCMAFSIYNKPVNECVLLADKFLEIEGDVPHDIMILTPFISTYYEYGTKYNDRAAIQKAKKYALIGYNLSINSKDESDNIWYFDKYLGLSIFQDKPLGIEELEKIEFHLGRYCSKESSDEYANLVLDMTLKMKHSLVKNELMNLRRSSGPTPTKKEEKKKGGFFSKLFG